MIAFVELFSGIGGFRYGLESLGWLQQEDIKGKEGKGFEDKRVMQDSRKFNCVWANDINKYANQTYKKNFGEKELYEGDIRAIDVKRIPNHDLLCAGFPCQAFSIAGKRQGFDDTRGTLFFEIARILEAKRPKTVLLENVKGLLSHDGGRTFARILSVLDKLGYWVEWQVLNSKNFGVPQNRERVFIVGHLRGKSFKQVFPIGESSKKINQPTISKQVASTIFASQHKIARGMNMIELNENLPDAKGLAWRTRTYRNQPGHFEIRKDNIANQLTTVEKDSLVALNPSNFQGKSYVEGKQSIALSQPSGNNQTLVKQKTKIRRLTPIECERLQGFPDNWTKGLSDTQRYKGLGNAVTTNVIQAIGEKLK